MNHLMMKMIKKMIQTSKTLNLLMIKIKAVKVTTLIPILKATHPPLLTKLRRASKRVEMSRPNPSLKRRIPKVGKATNKRAIPKLANSKVSRATKAISKIRLRPARIRVNSKNNHSSPE